MGHSASSSHSDIAVAEVSQVDPPLDNADDSSRTGWVWVLVRSTTAPAQQVWVRYAAEHSPEGRPMKPARPPTPGSLGVVVVSTPDLLDALPDAARPKRLRRRAPPPPADRNLVTVIDFASVVGCAESSVFDLIKLGLPSIKSPGIGRRILKEQALAWLIAGGARRSKIALRLAKAARRSKADATKGAANGSR